MKRFAAASESPQTSLFALARFAASREHCGKTVGSRLCATSITPLNTDRFADRFGSRTNRSIVINQNHDVTETLKTAEGTLTERLLRGFLASLTTLLFVFILPFLLGLLLIPTLPPDDRFFLKAAFTFLSPF